MEICKMIDFSNRWEIDKNSSEDAQLTDFINFVNDVLLETKGNKYVETIERTCTQTISKASKFIVQTKHKMTVIEFSDFGAIVERTYKGLKEPKVCNYGQVITIRGIARWNAYVYVVIDNNEKKAYFSCNRNYLSGKVNYNRVTGFFDSDVALIPVKAGA